MSANENGLSFFKHSIQELVTRLNVALFTINNRKGNPGYGQSIHHDNYLVLENCLSYVGNFKILTEGALPSSWPKTCHEPVKLQQCPGFKQPKSVLSNTSSSGTTDGTPRTLRRQRTIEKRSIPSTPQSCHMPSHGSSVGRKKSGATSSESGRRLSGHVRSSTLEKSLFTNHQVGLMLMLRKSRENH